MIKIAYLDYSHIFAGAERALHTIIENINTTIYSPVLIFTYPQKHQKSYNDLDCQKKWLSHKLRWWMGSDKWRHPLKGSDFIARTIWGIRLAIYLKTNHIDILHVNLLRPDVFMWLWPSKISGIKIIGHFRSQAISWIPPKRVQKCCKIILCVSKYSQCRLMSKGIYARSIVIYDSIDIATFKSNLSKSEAKQEIGFDKNCFLITSVGQLSPQKGHDNAIQAFSIIAEKYTNTILFIAGGGNSDNLIYLKSLAENVGLLNKRIFFSEQQMTNILEVYRASDLILSLTKVGEAFGLVPYEATCMGTPFIGPDKGAIKEFVTNKVNGLLVDPNSIDEIASNIKWVIENRQKAERISENLYHIITRSLSPQTMINNLTRIYNILK